MFEIFLDIHLLTGSSGGGKGKKGGALIQKLPYAEFNEVS